MLIVLVRVSSVAFAVDRDPDYVPPVTADEVFAALPTDHRVYRFLDALLYHVWCSINLAPPFHAAYLQLLTYLLALNWAESEKHPLVGDMFFEPGVLDRCRST
jgi:hypothetical protein